MREIVRNGNEAIEKEMMMREKERQNARSQLKNTQKLEMICMIVVEHSSFIFLSNCNKSIVISI